MIMNLEKQRQDYDRKKTLKKSVKKEKKELKVLKNY